MSGLQKLINICEDFSNEYNVTFNSKKTVCVPFGQTHSNGTRRVSLGGASLEWRSHVKYLGNYLSTDLSDDLDIRHKQGDFISATNKLNCVFRTVSCKIKMRLFQSYCTAWYGSQCWLLGSNSAKRMNISWQKSVRRLLNLPYRTHCKVLPVLSNCLSFQEQHKIRTAKMIRTMINSSNDAINFIASKAVNNAIGHLGQNVIYLRLQYGSLRDGAFRISPSAPDPDVTQCAQQISELLEVRDGSSRLQGMHMHEILQLIDYLCTS